MKGNFVKKSKKTSGIEWDSDVSFLEHAKSPDQVALIGSHENEVVAAIPIPGTVSGTYDLDVSRLPSDFDLAQALKLRRENHFDQAPISVDTNFLTVVSDFSERTRILSLSGEVLSLNDWELSEWLVNAERGMMTGIDGHPIFETSLQDTACSIRRLPNGQIAMTEVPRQHIDATRENLRAVFGHETISPINLIIETPLRAVARFFLTGTPEGAAAVRPEKKSEVTAFLLIGKAGFSYGLWSPSAGLFSEYAFLAPKEISGGDSDRRDKNNAPSYPDYQAEWKPAGRDSGKLSAKVKDDPESGEEARLQSYIQHAFDQLFLQFSPEKLEELQLSSYAEVVWATEQGLFDTVAPVAAEYAEKSGVNFIGLDVPLDEAAAGGLIFGSFTFGDETVAGAELLPPVNLARDLLILADKEEINRRLQEEVGAINMRSRAVFAVWAAPVMVLACILALTADIVRQKIALSMRDVQAETQTQELKPALERRKSYEETLKWYQEFITQVSALRRQQPVGIGMLYEMNRNYPLMIDPSFYVSDMKLLPTGGVEIKGLARNKDAVTSFIRSLEFAGGSESGTRLFSNLTYEVQEGVATPVVQAGGQTISTGLAGNNLAPGIVAWNIKGNYLPIAEFLPPDPAKAAAVAPGKPAVNAANNAAASAPPPPAAAPAQ